MAESADTSDPVANGAGFEPGAASAAAPARPEGSAAAGVPGSAAPGWAGRVDFYVLEGQSAFARLKLACKLAEKAYQSAQSVLVWHADAQELKTLDDLLWTFSDGSFVPHEPVGADTAPQAPVLLSAGIAPTAPVDIVINLAAEVPPFLAQTRRVAEIIDGDDERRRAGRARFKAYRELGIQPASHNIRGE